MPQITRIVAGKRNPERANIYLDGKFSFAISLETVLREHLKKGLELSAEQVSAYQAGDAEAKVYGKILNFLSYRPRSVKETRDRLREYLVGGDQKEIEGILDKLVREGYLSDMEFAKWFAASRAGNRPRSRRQLLAELAGKGIAREVISEVLPTNDNAALKSLIARHKGYSREKLVSYLARKGFSYADIVAALEE